jgi:CBS domain-containing protein
MADFLAKHAPFQFLDETDLVDLARAGRVKFHEVGETIFTHGQPRDQFVYVVQEGKVRILFDDLSSADDFKELRGPGDILGLAGMHDNQPYLESATTDSDTILYGFPRKEFLELIDRSKEARRYLEAYFALDSGTRRPAGRDSAETAATPSVGLKEGGLYEVEQPQRFASRSLFTVGLEESIGSVAGVMRENGIDCVVVVDSAGRAAGLISDSSLRTALESRPLSPDMPAGEVMSRDFLVVGPDENTGQLLLQMSQSNRRHLVVTPSGGLDSKVCGLVTERDLFLLYGRLPNVLSEAITSAKSISMLRMMRDRMEVLLLDSLSEPNQLPWLMEITGILNRKLIARLLDLAVEEMAAEGERPPPVNFSWLLMGSGGRDEMLIRSAVYHALVYDDPDEASAEEVKKYFLALAHRVSYGLRHCGFLESPQEVLAQRTGWCLPISEMKLKFSRMIAKPVAESVYEARDAFDFQPVKDNFKLALELREHIFDEIQERPEFIRHMARDSLLNQPPRTIYRGTVIDREGTESDELDIKYLALLPLVDVARVLSLNSWRTANSATYWRFEQAADELEDRQPEVASLFRRAAGAFLVAAYCRTLSGLQEGTDGAVIRPDTLTAGEQELLKVSFRTILELLEYTAERFPLSNDE